MQIENRGWLRGRAKTRGTQVSSAPVLANKTSFIISGSFIREGLCVVQ
jgi:hypothetical protein